MRYTFLILGAALLAACGETTASNTAVPSSGALLSSPSATAAASLMMVGNKGSFTGVLSDAKSGLTLYYFTPDSAGTTKCTGGCATEWPPVVVPAGITPTAPAGVTGTCAAVARPEGTQQLSYNGWLLYTYKPDVASADVKGQGVGGKWFVATASLAAPSAAAAAATPTESSTP